MRRILTTDDLSRMNLPEEFWRTNVQELAPEMLGTVTRYLRDFSAMKHRGAGLLLGGLPGLGKTAIAALVLKEARALGFTGMFIGIWELREGIRARAMYDGEMSLLDRCRDVDVLVLDGLRPEDATEMIFNLRAFEELLAGRGAKKKISVVTTRLSGQDLREKMPSLLDSVQGCMVYLAVTGPNRRRAQNEELRKIVLGG